MVDTVQLDHFLSSHHLFEYAFQHHYRFGVDIIDNVGPYGFLHYPYTYTGGVYWAKMAWFAAMCGLYAYYAMRILSQMQGLVAKGFFLFVVLYCPLQMNFPWFAYEVLPRLAIILSALTCLLSQHSKKSQSIHCVINGLFYGALIVEKASNVYFLGLILVVLMGYMAMQRRWRDMALLFVTMLTSMCVLWRLAGQPWSTLPTYFSVMGAFIEAYQHVMLDDMPTALFALGIINGGLLACLLGMRLYGVFKGGELSLDSVREVAIALLIGALFFLSWKHGMLRGVHSYGTFLYLSPVLLMFLCAYPGHHMPRNLNMAKPWLMLGVLLVFLGNEWFFMSISHAQHNAYQELKSRVLAWIHFQPIERQHTLIQKYKAVQAENTLPPALMAHIGHRRVDELGSMPEVLLLNQLNYRPRPVPIDFIVANRTLSDANAHYYQNPKSAPDVVWLTDFGFKTADVSTYLQVLLNYQVLDSYQHWLVMKRKGQLKRVSFERLVTENTQLGNWVDLHPWQQQFLWLQSSVKPTLFGRIKHFLYKPEHVTLVLKLADGERRTVTLTLPQLRDGVLLNPVMKSRTMLRYVAHDPNDVPWDEVMAFKIIPKHFSERYFLQSTASVTLSSVTVSEGQSGMPTVLTMARAKQWIQPFPQDYPIVSTRLPINLIDNTPRHDLTFSGWGIVERVEDAQWRWGFGPLSSLDFFVEKAGTPWQLDLRAVNELNIPQQTLTILLNDSPIYQCTAEGKPCVATVPLAVKPGINKLSLKFSDWNHGKVVNIKQDPRLLGMKVTEFVIHATDSPSGRGLG